MYPRTSSRSYMSKTSVLWLTIDSHVLLPCHRTPFPFDLKKSTFVCVHVEVLFGAERVFEQEGKHSALLER